MARLLGASTILARNDLEYERYRTMRPPRLWALLTDPAAGLGAPDQVGPPIANVAPPDRPCSTRCSSGCRPTSRRPRRSPCSPCRAASAPRSPPTGSSPRSSSTAPGEGFLAAGAAGLLDDATGPVLFGADLARRGHRRRRRSAATPAGSSRTPTASSSPVGTAARERRGDRAGCGRREPRSLRRRGHRPGPGPAAGVADRRRVGGRRPQSGPPPTASDNMFLPEDRPANAFDGDLGTAWRVDTASPGGSVSASRSTPVVRLQAGFVTWSNRRAGPAPSGSWTPSWCSTGPRRFPVEIDADHAFDPEGVRVDLDGSRSRTLEVELTAFEPPFGPAGLAEVQIPGVTVTELVRPPTAMLARLGEPGSGLPLAFVLSRLRADAGRARPRRSGAALQRRLDLAGPGHPAAHGFGSPAPRGRQRPGGRAASTPPDPSSGSSEHLAGALAATRVCRGLDGDLATAWTTPFVGSWTSGGRSTRASASGSTRSSSTSWPIRGTACRSGSACQVDGGQEQIVPVPRDRRGALGATRHVTISAHRSRCGARPSASPSKGPGARTTPDWYSELPGRAADRPRGDRRHGRRPRRPRRRGRHGLSRRTCSPIDGEPVPVRIAGGAHDALARDGSPDRACDDEPVVLSAGPHDLVATPGDQTGIDLDRLVLHHPRVVRPSARHSR